MGKRSNCKYGKALFDILPYNYVNLFVLYFAGIQLARNVSEQSLQRKSQEPYSTVTNLMWAYILIFF
jgi:hypothetical protein